MTGKKQLTELQTRAILALLKQNWSVADIQQALSLSDPEMLSALQLPKE